MYWIRTFCRLVTRIYKIRIQYTTCVLNTNFVDWWLRYKHARFNLPPITKCVLNTNFVDWWHSYSIHNQNILSRCQLCIEYEFCRLVTSIHNMPFKSLCFTKLLLCIEYEFCRLVTKIIVISKADEVVYWIRIL